MMLGELFLDPAAITALLADAPHRERDREQARSRLGPRETEVIKLLAKRHSN